MTQAVPLGVLDLRGPEAGVEEHRHDALEILLVARVVPGTLEVQALSRVADERQQAGFPAVPHGAVRPEAASRRERLVGVVEIVHPKRELAEVILRPDAQGRWYLAEQGP